MSRGPLPGFRDFYPAEFAERAFIFGVWREVARRYGFQEYDGPPLEPLELYTKKSGDEIVGQLYAFEDKGGRQVALRPEMTPTVARMVAERANALRRPARWFSIPQLFRYERQQKGRLREHFQLNVDIFGEADVTADAELVAAAVDMMRAFGLTSADVKVRFSDRALLNAVLRGGGIPEERFPAVYAVLDKLERQPREVSAARLVEGGFSEDEAVAFLGFVTASVEAGSIDAIAAAVTTDEGRAELERVRRFASDVSLLVGSDAADWLRFDLSIVRGLAYYTGIVFEIFDAQGEFRAIAGGGRYDNLLDAVGGVAMPALGFGMGDVVLGELLRARGLMPSSAPSLDYWVAFDAPEVRQVAISVAVFLRRLAHSVEYPLRDQALAKQLKAAVAAGARHAVIFRKEAVADGGMVTVRSLADGQETTVPVRDWLEFVQRERAAARGGPADPSQSA